MLDKITDAEKDITNTLDPRLKILSTKVIEQIGKLLNMQDKENARKLLIKSYSMRDANDDIDKLCLILEIDHIEEDLNRSYMWSKECNLDTLICKYDLVYNVLEALKNNGKDAAGNIIELINKNSITPEGIIYYAAKVFDNSIGLVERLWEILCSGCTSEVADSNDPLVSVVVTTYNHQDAIVDVIDSVINQTYANFELIITDDGSTDDTREVIRKKLSELNDSRISFYPYEENTCFENIEKSYHLAKGKYIAHLGGDDMMHPDKLLRQVRFLESSRDVYKACFTWVECVGDNEKLMSDFESLFNNVFGSSKMLLERILLRGNCLCAPSFMMDREIFEELGTQNFTYRQLQDYELWLKYLMKYRLFVIPERLTLYRVSEGSVSITRDQRWHILCSVENSNILYETMLNMPADVFISTFNDMYTDMDAVHTSGADIKCRKVKLLLEIGKNMLSYGDACIRLYYNYRNDEKFMRLMHEQYGLGRKEMYEYAYTYSSIGQSMLCQNEYNRFLRTLEENNITLK